MSQPDFDYRTFYTWDHSTNWDLTQPGTRLRGCHEPYEKPAGAFIEDYTRLVDFMSELGLNHLIIWGALRDSHGGVDTLKRLTQHGLTKGVRVAPGVGVNCYGGVYYEGEHEYSLARLLQQQPELACDVLTAFRDEEVSMDLPPRVARAAARAEGQTKVRLNWLAFELQCSAERVRAGGGAR